MMDIVIIIGLWIAAIAGVIALLLLTFEILDRVDKNKLCAHDFGDGLKYYKHVPCCLKCGVKLTDTK